MTIKDPEAKREYHKSYMDKWYKGYYADNKDRIIAKAAEGKKRRVQERTALIRDLKSVPCVDCRGTFPPECMDFDHLRDKKFSISEAVNKGVALKRLLDEIAKCEVVCSNCHRIRTNSRRQTGARETVNSPDLESGDTQFDSEVPDV